MGNVRPWKGILLSDSVIKTNKQKPQKTKQPPPLQKPQPTKPQTKTQTDHPKDRVLISYGRRKV